MLILASLCHGLFCDLLLTHYLICTPAKKGCPDCNHSPCGGGGFKGLSWRPLRRTALPIVGRCLPEPGVWPATCPPDTVKVTVFAEWPSHMGEGWRETSTQNTSASGESLSPLAVVLRAPETRVFGICFPHFLSPQELHHNALANSLSWCSAVARLSSLQGAKRKDR